MTAAAPRDHGPVPPDEIARVLAAMRRRRPLDIRVAAADLDARERRLNQRGIDRGKSGIEDVFR